LPDGLSGDLPVQPLLQKDSGFRRTQIKSTSQPSRPHKRGVSRSSRTLGTGCGGRGSVRRAAARGRVMLISRTVKSCGPDAPTLASSFRRIICAGDGGKKARSPGRARSKPLKPLRREGRVKPVDLAATTLVCHQHFAHEAAGAAGTRLSLRPLFFEAKDLAQLGRIAPRDRGRVSYAKARHCEERSDEAIHSFLCAARWITSRSLSSGAHSRDPLARNDGESRARRPSLTLPWRGRVDGRIRSTRLTIFWHCGLPHFSSRTGTEARFRQPTVNGFGRESGFQKGLAMLIRSQMYGVRGGAAKTVRARAPAASLPTLSIGGLLLLIGP
jgi:hypothetical protein